MIRLISALVFFAGLTSAEYAGASPFHFVNSNKQTNLNADLERAYEFVVAKASDTCNRAQHPIKIEFAKLEGRSGFTPHSNTKCDDKILLDNSLEGNWAASVTLAHELTHVLRHQTNPNEEAWLDEGLAKQIEYEYAHLWPQTYFNAQAGSRFSISSDLNSYTAKSPSYLSAFLLVHYLDTHLGDDFFIRKVMTSKLSGWSAVEEAARVAVPAANIGIPLERLNRRDLFTHFAFALWFNDSLMAQNALFQISPIYKSMLTLESKMNSDSATSTDASVRISKTNPWIGKNNTRVYAVSGTQIDLVKSNEPITAELFLEISLPK